ncbi:MAG: PaaX family transcriptional regulator C-terminal domain-containing protein [Candidatus Roizmanbacteria bacterium]
MPVKDRKLKLLLLLFFMSDFSFSPIELTEDLQDIFDVSMNQKTKGTISSLLKDGSIVKEDTDKVLYTITEKGLGTIFLEFPMFRFIHSEWDGLWRIISYEIPEEERHLRDRLRREMRGWGLGPWHRSFWITPHPIIPDLRNLVYGSPEEKYIQAFEATHVAGPMDILVEKVWGKSTLESSYRELFKLWHSILSETSENKVKFKQVVYEYIKIVRDDPGLPASLIGRTWIGFEAFTIFKEIRGILMK